MRLRLNFTPAEVERLNDYADLSGMPLRDYLRRRLLRRRAPRAGVPRVNLELIGKLAKLGNNVNQLARQANSGGRVSARLAPLLAAVLRELWHVRRALLGLPQEDEEPPGHPEP